MASANYLADMASLEVDHFLKTAPCEDLIFDPLYYDERASCALSVKGGNLRKQFIAARVIPAEPTREEFVNAIKIYGTDFSAAWKKEKGIDGMKL